MISKLSGIMASLFRAKHVPISSSTNDGGNEHGVDDMIPDYSVAKYVGGNSAEQFKLIGNQIVDWFKSYCNLGPDEKVLEVGCGIGRIAIPLTQHLTSGTYEGFDIVPLGIEWCQKRVAPRYPNFHFFVADVYNKYYHPKGRYPASEYTFPFDGASFDFVFLTSVFTHMLPKDLERYTSEIGRVLKPGGRCFCTAYIISEDARSHLNNGTSHRRFVSYPQGYWTDVPDNPEAAIAYSDDYLERVFTQAGLNTTRMIPGEWWKNEFAQDILITSKPVS
jgi:SAM-dependent methyltransferase